MTTRKTITFSCSENIAIGIYNPQGVIKSGITRSKVLLLSWPLPGRSYFKLESFYYNEELINIKLVSDNYCFEIGKMKDSNFIPINHDIYETYANHGSDLLARTVMFNSCISIHDGGPDYYQIKDDSFWFNFINESWNLSLIAAIQNL